MSTSMVSLDRVVMSIALAELELKCSVPASSWWPPWIHFDGTCLQGRVLEARQCDSNALSLCEQCLRRMVRSAVSVLRCHWGTQQRQIGRITCHVMMIHWLQHVVDKCQWQWLPFNSIHWCALIAWSCIDRNHWIRLFVRIHMHLKCEFGWIESTSAHLQRIVSLDSIRYCALRITSDMI